MTSPTHRILALALALTALAGLAGVLPPGASPTFPAAPIAGPAAQVSLAVAHAGGAHPSLTTPTSWVNVTAHPATAGPYPRMYPSEIFDPQFGGIILFGGINNASRTFVQPAFNDTWLYANGTWQNLTARFPVAPPARWAASFAWDAADGYALLFGGSTGGNGSVSGTFLNDTWGLNTTGWFPITTPIAPSPRGFAPMAYDDNLSETLLFSGGDIDFSNGTIQAYHDTWTYGDGTWTNISLTAGAGAGQASAMAYDPASGGVVAAGIMRPDSICAPLNQTWVFESNGTWNRVLNDSSPPPGGNMVYDYALGKLLYVGGCLQSNHAPLALTWEYANGSWTNLTNTLNATQAPLCCAALAYDAVQKVDVLFGGDRIVPSVRQGYVDWAYSFPVAPLTAAIHATRLTGAAPFAANLSSTRSGGAGPYAFAWSFGDGSPTGSTQNTTHTYTVAGRYVVNYTVTDSAGRSYNASLNLTVAPTLTVSAQALPAAGEAPLHVTFNATASGGFSPYQYSWNFSDGTTVTGANGTHVYEAGGVYVARLTVTDSASDVTSFNTTITVASPVSATVNRTPTIGTAPLTVDFTAAPTGGMGPFSYTWAFGDGTNGTGAAPTHTYATPGVYTVVLNLTDSYNRSVFVPTTVTVVAPLTATAAAGPSVGVAPLAVGFTATTHGGLAPFVYTWTFGDGSSGTGAGPTHTYGQIGNYTASLTITDALNESVTAAALVRVVGPLSVTPQPTFVLAAPATVTFHPTVRGGVGPYGYSWEFGDGALGLGSPISHTYSTAGSYNATVTVTDALGESASVTTMVVAVGPLTASLAADVSSVAVGSTVTLTVTTSGGQAPFNFTWTGLPGGCTPVNAPTLACTPTVTGSFTVTVEVSTTFETTNASTLVTVTSGPSSTGGGSGSSGFSTAELELLAGIIAVAGVIAVFGYILLRRPPAPKPLTPARTPGPAPADDEETPTSPGERDE